MNLNGKSYTQASWKSIVCNLALVSTFAVGFLGSTSFAQQQQPANPDFAPFTAAIYGANSTSHPTFSLDGQSATYALIRQDLAALTYAGVPASPEGAAVGYIGLTEPSSGRFFIDGAIPVLTSELPSLEVALQNANLLITAIDTQMPGLSQEVVNVHFEATVAAPNKNRVQALASTLAEILAAAHTPQSAVSIQPIQDSSSLGFDASFNALMAKGIVNLVDNNAIVVSIPRTDATPLTLGQVPATESLGVGHTIYLTGTGQAVTKVELALIPTEVEAVSKVLTQAGFTLTSQGGYFTNDSKRITFLHAVAVTNVTGTLMNQVDAVAAAIALTQSAPSN